MAPGEDLNNLAKSEREASIKLGFGGRGVLKAAEAALAGRPLRPQPLSIDLSGAILEGRQTARDLLGMKLSVREIVVPVLAMAAMSKAIGIIERSAQQQIRRQCNEHELLSKPPV